MRIENFNKFLKIFIIALALFLIIAIPISIISYKKEPRELNVNPCTTKGKICTPEEIFSGVEVEVEVKKSKRYIFNVISNDENTMTLLMNKNISDNIDWHAELINVKGPQEAMNKVVSSTKSWENIDNIASYEYKDFGKVNYENLCQNNEEPEPGYDCSEDLERGYDSINITNGKITINMNLTSPDPEFPINNVSNYIDDLAKARLITFEEINSLNQNNQLPKWLISDLSDHEGYWTLTSSTAMKSGYCQGAVALANNDNAPSIESLYVMKTYQSDFKIGIRPVITINKK